MPKKDAKSPRGDGRSIPTNINLSLDAREVLDRYAPRRGKGDFVSMLLTEWEAKRALRLAHREQLVEERRRELAAAVAGA
jgi:hypothetical protein